MGLEGVFVHGGQFHDKEGSNKTTRTSRPKGRRMARDKQLSRDLHVGWSPGSVSTSASRTHGCTFTVHLPNISANAEHPTTVLTPLTPQTFLNASSHPPAATQRLSSPLMTNASETTCGNKPNPAASGLDATSCTATFWPPREGRLKAAMMVSLCQEYPLFSSKTPLLSKRQDTDGILVDFSRKKA